MEGLNINMLDKGLRKKIGSYLEEWIGVYGRDIVSLGVYGNTSGAEARRDLSEVNILAVLDKVGLEQMDKGLKLIAKGAKAGIAAPLMLTLEHIRTSQDSFPIEFLEMKESYVCVYGRDVLKDLHVDRGNLRLFCEQQLKGKLIRLRQAYLEIGLKRKGVEALLKDCLRVLFPVFRSCLRLKNIVVPLKKEDVLLRLGREFGLTVDGFIAILRDRENDEKINGEDVRVFLGKFVREIGNLAEKIDKFSLS
ncbi:MAG: hypothetical protein ACE5GG_02910 [Candidatus Omnitrophota bacterium]